MSKDTDLKSEFQYFDKHSIKFVYYVCLHHRVSRLQLQLQLLIGHAYGLRQLKVLDLDSGVDMLRNFSGWFTQPPG